MVCDDIRPDDMARRLDSFVDAAFAFAVTLVIVSTAAPSGLDELANVLGRAPSIIASFALIVMFWLGYRSVSRLTPHRDALTTALCLAIVLLVTLYVFPLRLMFETAFHLASGGLLPGRNLARSPADFRFLYAAYGIGYLALSGLFCALYGLALKRSGSTRLEGDPRLEARIWMVCWTIMIAVATVSILLALLGPAMTVAWAPGVAYMLIPAGIGLYMAVFQKDRSRPVSEVPAP